MAYTDIDDPTEYFGTTLYTGNETVRAITFDGNSDLDVDWIWLKSRSSSGNHHVYDTVRGTQKHLRINLTNAEGTNGGTDGVTAFGSNGFTVGANTGSNQSGVTFVGWGWKAGTSFTNDASGTGIGTIDSTGSVNTDAGFAIISYTATGSAETIAHGLGTTPGLIITKRRNGADSWFVWNKTFSATQYLSMDTTNAVGSASTVFGTLPTSTVYSTGGGGGTGTNGGTYISYLFAEKQGYSKFGSYTGNGNADGTFVYTGFKPAFTLIKRTDSTTGGSWILFDNKRGANVINPVDVVLAASNNATESDWGTTYDCDYLSNGFKWRHDGSSGYVNVSGANYTFYAFAENPFVTSTGVPATAR